MVTQDISKGLKREFDLGFSLSLFSPTLEWVFLVLRDLLQVADQVGLQSSGAGEEACHYPEHLPAEGTGVSVAGRVIF